MTIELWATYSVRDHLVRRAFVADVLLYDRLVIPTLPQGAPEYEWPWLWDLAKQRTLLGDLGHLAIQIPWDVELHRAWQLVVERGAAGTDAIRRALQDALLGRNPRHGPLYDPLDPLDDRLNDPLDDPQYRGRGDWVIRALLQEVVQKAWPGSAMEAVSAYPSFDASAADAVASNPNIDTRRLPPTVVFGWEFFFPNSTGVEDRRLLELAIELATKTEFIEMRADFHRWWRNVTASGMSVAAVKEDMKKQIVAYQKYRGQGWKKTAGRYATKAADSLRRGLGPIHKIFAGPLGILGSANPFYNERLAWAVAPAGRKAAAR